MDKVGDIEDRIVRMEIYDALSIDELDLSFRPYNYLKRGGINTIGELVKMTPSELFRLKHFDQKCYVEIVRILAERGLSLKEEPSGNSTEIINHNQLRDELELLNSERNGIYDGLDIRELECGTRAFMCLKKAGVNTIGDVCKMTPSELFGVKNLGRKSYEEVIRQLEWRGLSLKEESTGTSCED